MPKLTGPDRAGPGPGRTNPRGQGQVFPSHSRLQQDGSSQPSSPAARRRSPCFYGRRNNVRDRVSERVSREPCL